MSYEPQKVANVIQYVYIIICISFSHTQSYFSCVAENVQNSSHALDQMFSSTMNGTDIDVKLNLICNADISGIFKHLCFSTISNASDIIARKIYVHPNDEI